MAAVPVNMMHGLPIPTPMQVMPCSSMLSIPISTMSYNTTNNTVTDFTNPPVQQDSTTNHVNSSSPSRSLPSASPPALGMVNGSTVSASSPLPEENPEYLKELQAEKDTLELSVTTQNGTTTTGENNENNENQNKTNHALKLLEQGKQKSISVFGPMGWFTSGNIVVCSPTILSNVRRQFWVAQFWTISTTAEAEAIVKAEKKIRDVGNAYIFPLLEKWIVSKKK